jgi:hypothetical protein
MHLLVQGGVKKRSGTRYVGLGLTNSATAIASRLIPFVFSESQAYVLEFSDRKLGFIINGGFVVSGPNRYTINTPYLIADVARLNFVQSADVMYIVHPNYPIYKLARLAETNWTLTEVKLKNGPWLDVNVKDNAATPTGFLQPAVTVVSSTATTDIAPAVNVLDFNAKSYWRLDQYAGRGATLTFTFTTAVVVNGYTITALGSAIKGVIAADIPVTAPRDWRFEAESPTGWITLDRRVAETNWLPGEERSYTFSSERSSTKYRIVFEKDNGTDQGMMVSGVTMSLVGSAGTLTFENTTNVNFGAGFTANDIGRQVRWQGADGHWRVLTITGVADNKQLSGTWEGFWAESINGSPTWRLGAVSKASGYPQSVTLYQSRLVFGGTRSQPRTVYMSAVSDFENFTIQDPLTDDSPIATTLSGRRFDSVNWAEEAEDLLIIGTADGIVSLGGTENNVISPTNIRQRRHTGVGASPGTWPIRIGTVLLFIDNHQLSVHELIYSSQANGYDAPSLAPLSDHLYASRALDIALAHSPLDTAYIRTGNGKMIALTYEQAQKVVGHAEFDFGGMVLSHTVIPEDGEDTLYMLIQRTIDGVDRHYIERLQPVFDGDDTDLDAWFLDSALEYNGAPTTIITGLDHLEGETVQIFAYDFVSGGTFSAPAETGDPVFTRTVLGGAITLPIEVSHCIVGLPLLAYIKMLNHAVETTDGSSFGRLSTVDGVLVTFLKSRAVSVRAAEGLPAEPLILRKGGQNMDEYTPLFSGVVSVPIDSSWTIPDALEFISDTPHPCTILSVTTMVDREPGTARRSTED